MTGTISGLVVLMLFLLGAPASAGEITRSVFGGREVVTIVDHGRTRGQPAVRIGARGRTTPPKRGAKTDVAADEASAGRALTPGATPPVLDVMATQAVTSILAFRLLSSGAVAVPDIDTDPTARDLRLLGAVPNEAARVTVAAQAMEIAGVPAVRNELQVLSEWEPNPYLVFDDEHVQERVERAVLSWPELHAADIQVTVNQGVTTLTGSVATADQRVLASTAAASAPGVYLVQNRLSLLPE